MFPASSDSCELHVLDAGTLQEGCGLLAELQIVYTWVSITSSPSTTNEAPIIAETAGYLTVQL